MWMLFQRHFFKFGKYIISLATILVRLTRVVAMSENY